MSKINEKKKVPELKFNNTKDVNSASSHRSLIQKERSFVTDETLSDDFSRSLSLVDVAENRKTRTLFNQEIKKIIPTLNQQK